MRPRKSRVSRLPRTLIPRHNEKGEFFVVVTGPFGGERIPSVIAWLDAQGFSQCPPDTEFRGWFETESKSEIRDDTGAMLKVDMAREMEFGAQSDVGCVRENNEDSYRIALGAEVSACSPMAWAASKLEKWRAAWRWTQSSRTAVEAETHSSLPLVGPANRRTLARGRRLASAIRLSNTAVHHSAQQAGVPQGSGRNGCGCSSCR